MTRDAFDADREQRDRLTTEVYAVRAAMFEAVETDDAQAALSALKRACKLAERFPDAKLLCTGQHDALPGQGVLRAPRGRVMPARFGGVCSVCSDRFAAGDVIDWVGEERKATCARCFDSSGGF
jgi:hypothetical protein